MALEEYQEGRLKMFGINFKGVALMGLDIMGKKRGLLAHFS